MFGSVPGDERRQGVMNQYVVSKLEADDVDYFVLHTRGENPRSILITTLTKHYGEQKPKKSTDQIAELVHRLVSAVINERTYRDVSEYDRVKDIEVYLTGQKAQATIESIVSKATNSCVIGIVKKTKDDADAE